jgi:Carboxypeptidase regulatory-like domain
MDIHSGALLSVPSAVFSFAVTILSDPPRRVSITALKKPCIAALALSILFLQSALAFGAEVAGRITETGGTGVEGIRISFKDASGGTVASAESGKDGSYQISGLGAGNYSATLDPGKTGYRGTTVAVSVGPTDVLCVNWFISPTAEALAIASPNNQAGASLSPTLAAAACQAPGAFAAASAGTQILVAGGIGAAACAAAGCFEGVTNTPPKMSQRRPGD